MHSVVRAFLLGITSLFLVAAGASAATASKPVPGRLLVMPQAGVGPAAFQGQLSRLGAKAVGSVVHGRVKIVSVPANAEDAVASALRHSGLVRFVEQDRSLPPTSTTADDPYYGKEWHLATIGAPTAWDNARGAGITVAVLDTGVDGTHPDLQGQLVPGWNIYDNNSNTADVYGHGTEVAGVVAALSNNALGVTSVAWNAKIMPVRISQPDGMAYLSDIASGLTWAADHGARVANISYAVSGSATVQQAADYMRSKGGVVVVAAGNSGGLVSTAPSNSMLSVSATTSSDTLASWSSYGNYVDLSAPGVGIWSTTNGGGYAAVSGTSFSSPITAGVAALVLSVNPALTPTQVDDILTSTAVDLGTPGYDEYFGYGRVDAAAAVAAALNTQTDTTAPTASITSPGGGATVSGTVTVDVNATDNTGVTKVELYVDGQLVGTDLSAPYTFSWDTTGHADGSATLTAYAYDAAGNKGSAAPVAVTVSNNTTSTVSDTQPPTVVITSPANGSQVSGTVKIDVSAQDNQAVSQVECLVDGAVLGVSTSSPLQCNWNTRKVAAGTHTISAQAVDAAGNQASTSIQVTVAGGSPQGHGKGKK
ncbi:MAG: S8 family serine peptidase [Gammaproteobacteria bacterium]